MSQELTLYVAFPGDADDRTDEVVEAIRGLASVVDVEAHREDAERGALEVVQSVTLTVTAMGGAVAATNVFVEQVQRLLARFGARSAQVDAGDGLRELSVSEAPRNENPAQ
jgi:hypothetical protein